MAGQVDLVVNVFERTYRDVLTLGWWPHLTNSIGYPFTKRVALINNTDDPADAARLADQLVAADEIDEWHYVADHVDAALATVGLSLRDLEPLAHFSDCALVALALPAGSPFMAYWDADVTLDQPCDWITPSLAMMASEATVIVANPSWDDAEAVAEASHTVGDFVVGYGFSDTTFLCERARVLALPWRGPMAPASYRYPLAHVAAIFEQRLDSAMRRTRLQRATYLPARTSHHGTVGTQYPHAGFTSRV
ncbi:MAG: hypothetical protein GX616_27200, partial [Planctomycetes bacterium]|nr:hypothetical protein [Planctomycetota bacterium]